MQQYRHHIVIKNTRIVLKDIENLLEVIRFILKSMNGKCGKLFFSDFNIKKFLFTIYLKNNIDKC